MTEYQIEANTRRCVVSGRELKPGEKYYSVLTDEGGKFQRREARILGRQGDRYFLVPRDIVFGDEKVGVDVGVQVGVTLGVQVGVDVDVGDALAVAEGVAVGVVVRTT